VADIDIRITGAEKLRDVGKRLRAVGPDGKELRKEFFRGMQRAGKPLKQAAIIGARRDLPHRGGLAEDVAKSGFSIKTRTAGNGVGVKVVAKGRKVRGLGALDRGRLRHPVYGNREVWVIQKVRPAWFTDALAAQAEPVQREMLAAMDATLRKI
jgi:hypothetical protein